VSAARVCVSAALLAGLGCSGAPAPTPSPPLIVARPLDGADAGAAAPELERGSPLASTVIGTVPEGTFGPYQSTRSDGRTLAVWAAQESGSGRRWFAVPLDPRGVPLSQPRSISEAPPRVGLVALRPTQSGFVVLSTAPSSSGTAVDALPLGTSAELVAPSQSLGHVHEDVLWLDAITLGYTTSALFATRAAGSASLHLAPLAEPNKPQRAAVTLVEGALAWQALPFADGIALSVVFGKGNPTPGVRVLFFDGEGQPLADTLVTGSPRVQPELDAAVIGQNLVLVWSELDGLEPALRGAAIAPDGRLVTPARPLLDSGGTQRLEQIVAPFDGSRDGYLVWQLEGEARAAERALSIAPLSSTAELGGARARLRFEGERDAGLELVASGHGLAALTRAPACTKDEPRCSGPALPIFVEWSEALEPIATEPLRLDVARGQSADLAWALRCSRETCSALAAAALSPVPLYGVELRRRSEQWRTPEGERAARDAPTLERARSVLEDEPIADIASTSLGARSLLAWITEFDPTTPYVKPTAPAPDGRMAPVRAQLRVATVGAEDVRSLEPETISYRAHSPGGVALASAPGDARALLAWSALDEGQPQVFVTQLDRSGKRVAQRMITRGSKGALEQISAVALGKGRYALAWLGEQDGRRRAKLTTLRPNLAPAAPAQALDTGAGVIDELALFGDAGGLWLVRSEQTEDARERLLLQALDAESGAPRGAAELIRQSDAGDIGSAVLARTAAGSVLLWVEHERSRARSGRLWLARLDRNGKLSGVPANVALERGSPRRLDALCSAERCRGVVAVREVGSERLDAFSWDQNKTPLLHTLAHRGLAPSEQVEPLALNERGLWFATRRPSRGVLRRLLIDW
jgi:hypothetical protein